MKYKRKFIVPGDDVNLVVYSDNEVFPGLRPVHYQLRLFNCNGVVELREYRTGTIVIRKLEGGLNGQY